LSWAINCVTAVWFVISHSVAVVSIEHVTTEFGETAFQLSEVIGGRLVAGSLLWSLVAYLIILLSKI
jgi:hypothetical protein